MSRLPDFLHDKYPNHGESFFRVIELLYNNYDRQFTQDDLEKEVGVSKTRISKFTSRLESDDWIKRREGQTTFEWDTDSHHPAKTEGYRALTGFYSDIWWLMDKHSQTVPGSFALLGFAMFVGAIVMLAFYLGFIVSGGTNSAISGITYLVIALGSAIVGMAVSLLSPVQAWLTRGYRVISSK